MAKGPKGPRTKRKILNRIIVLASTRPHMLGKEIRMQLEKEFNRNDVPSLRTIYQYISSARKEEGRSIQDKPWSLGMMDKAGIPWEATAWLLESYKECENRIEEYHRRMMAGEQLEEAPLWRLTNPYPMGTKPLEPVRGGYVFLTNRQARWLWHLRLVVPAQEFPDPFQELCHWADQYAHAEMTAEYWGQDLDTRAIDGDLMAWINAIKFKHELDKNEADRKQKTGKEE